MLTIHRTSNKKKDRILLISDGKSVQRITGKKRIKAWRAALPAGETLRLTAVNAADMELMELQEQGLRLIYAPWHATGIPKNLSAKEIVTRYANCPEAIFRPFRPRRDLVNLRGAVSMRAAIVELLKSCTLKLKAEQRAAGNPVEGVAAEMLKQGFAEEKRIKKGMQNPLDKIVNDRASQIPECQQFNWVAGFENSYVIAATVVAYSGGLERFSTVSAWWKYCGLTPDSKRRAGKPLDFNPRIKTALWQGSTTWMGKEHPRRASYVRYKEYETARHAGKDPGCKTPKGHCHAMAMRKVMKDIAKEFYLLARGRDAQIRRETHSRAGVSARA